MSSSSGDEIGINDVTQEIHKQQLVVRFDYPRRQVGPQIGALILRLLGFGIMVLVGINLDEAQIGDVVVEITHNGFYTHLGLGKNKMWSRGMGINLESIEAISFHLVPCIECHLQFLRGKVVYLE
jgi:hypothetical protein